MMAETSSGELILNPNVEIVPVREFSPDIQTRLGGLSSEYILSERTSRITSQRIAQEVTLFLRRFREPRRIVEAVLEHAAELGIEPSRFLNEIYPLITILRSSSVLIDPSAVLSYSLGPSLMAGEQFEGFVLIERVSALSET